MRAALLPAGGDPFLIAYWLDHYDRWSDQVDELRLLVCGQTLPDVLTYIRERAAQSRNVILHEYQHRLDHGAAIGFLLDRTEADLILLCEDDAFARHPQAIGEAFDRAECSNDEIIASPRGSISGEIEAAAADRFGAPPVMRSGETGNSFWPSFYFGWLSDLLATDRWYGARRWLPGDVIPGLDYTVTAEAAADTFASTTYQLRAAGLRVHWEPQYRADAAKMAEWLTHDPPWFHVGSLSTGYGYAFLPESTGRMSDGSFERIAAHVRETGGDDWAKRIAFWDLTLDSGVGLDAHRAQYHAEMTKFVVLAGIAPAQIAWWRDTFRAWVTW